MRILGIETSCDETAASVVQGSGDKIKVLSNVISSQIDIHKKYGGVVPEVAAREHVLNILPVINEALFKAGVYSPSQPSPRFLQSGGQALRRRREELFKNDLIKTKRFISSPLAHDNRNRRGAGVEGIDAISVAVGPGLVTSLLVGVETAKTLSYVWNVPAIGVNHIEGHVYANFINSPAPPFSKGGNIKFPALILTVSGGHTMLVLMKGHGKYTTIGETRDDAAGEAFDKAAAMMKIGYPGGPNVAFQATKVKSRKSKVESIVLPRPMINSKDYDFSFSGLKTALLYELQKDSSWKKRIPEYSFEFQQAVIDVLIKKTIKAAKDFKVKTVMLSGGVSANIELRTQLKNAVKGLDKVQFAMPDLKYTTDNAAMMAVAGYYKAKRKRFTLWQKLKVNCNLEL